MSRIFPLEFCFIG